MNTGVTLPYNEDAEQSFLGILLNNADIISDIEHKPRESDFYFERHRLLFSAIMQLWDGGTPADIISVSDYLSSQSKLKLSGGRSYISSLLEKGIVYEGTIEFYAHIIIQKSQRRRLIQFSGEILSLAQDESKEIIGVIEECEKNIFDVTDRALSKMYYHMEHYLHEFYDRVKERVSKEEKGAYSGIPTGFGILDSNLSGLQRGELIIIAARTSVGKTAFALNLVNNIALEQKIPVGFFSLEMLGREIVSRLVCQITMINNVKIRQNMLSAQELQKIMKSMDTFTNTRLFISDISRLSLFDLKLQMRRLVHKEGVKVIFIDYMGLISYYHRIEEDIARGKGILSRFEQFSEISRSLKMLARELDIPVVAIAQLNREGELQGIEPNLANIRDSGSIEQDADVVLFLHRDKKSNENNEGTSKNIIKLIIAKQRNGPTAKIDYEFRNLIFTELAGNKALEETKRVDKKLRGEEALQ